MTSRLTLGIHIGHDRGASIVNNGVLVSHIAQDRLDRVKHSEFPTIPFEAVDAVLEDCGITSSNLGAVGVSYVNAEVHRFTDELRDVFCDHYGIRDVPFVGVSHHMAHAFSVFWTSGYDEALVFVADGAGDAVGGMLESETLYIASGAQMKPVQRRLHEVHLDIPGRPFLFNYALMNAADRHKQISIAKKYEQFTNLVGFGHFQDGKTMGLASYGQPLCDVEGYKFDNLDFSLCCADLLKEIHELKIRSGHTYVKFVAQERANLAATAQAFVEHALVSLMSSFARQYGYQDLCLAGGVFLNCVANHKIVEQGVFRRVHIIPASGDDGQSVGAALYAYKEIFGTPVSTSNGLPFLGPRQSVSGVTQVASNFRLICERMVDRELSQTIAREIASGKVVGLVRGRSEMGPRALCHRSILADPRHSEMKDHLNEYVKFREAFRPYAPVVTWEDQTKYFELRQESPFMLLATKVRKPYDTQLRAITHVDGTARIQALSESTDPFLYTTLREFEKLTGFPILLNTSFNLAGDPIVESVHDAVSTFVATAIDLLVIDEYILRKPQKTTSE